MINSKQKELAFVLEGQTLITELIWMFFHTCQHSISLITASDTVYVKEEVEENLGVDKPIPTVKANPRKIFQLLR